MEMTNGVTTVKWADQAIDLYPNQILDDRHNGKDEEKAQQRMEQLLT